MESAELWVDSFDDTVHRLDRVQDPKSHQHLPKRHMPKPHFDTSSMQHTHTAYDAIDPDVSFPTPHVVPRIRTEIECASNPTPPSDPRNLAAASESPEAILAARVARVLQPQQSKMKQATQSPPSAATPVTATPVTATQTNIEVAGDHQTPAENIAMNPTLQTEPTIAKDLRTAEALRPNWEVDVFDIPQPVADLFFDEELFQDMSGRMKEAVQGGLQTMLMTSALTGEGRTTVAIGVALAAAASGLRVALVDGDLAEPTLAEEMRLDLDHSWVESVRRSVPMKEIAVHAVEDNLTLIPLLPTDSGRQATAVECAQVIESLKPSFDLIIVDGPTADARDIRMLGSAIDSVIIVHDVNQSSDAAAELLAARLQRAGIDGVGIVENFA